MTRLDARVRQVAHSGGDRPRAHGEHVAQNSADTGRRALIRLNVARVVVAFHFKYAGKPVTNIDDPSILTRSLDHPRPVGWECP